LPDMAMPWILIGIVAGRFGTIAEDEVEWRLLQSSLFFPLNFEKHF
jgi:prolipoprotein diacylglyceryltransferase